MITVEQYIITNRVKLNLLPDTFTYEIDGKIYESAWEEKFTPEERDTMIESALEEIAIEFANHCSEDEHEEFLTPLHKLHNQLLPDSPID